jgi:hypothetical protein
MNPIELLQTHKAARNYGAAIKSAQAQAEARDRTQFAGKVVGVDASRGLVAIDTDDLGRINATANTNGYLVPGQTVIATRDGGRFWVDGMPQ